MTHLMLDDLVRVSYKTTDLVEPNEIQQNLIARIKDVYEKHCLSNYNQCKYNKQLHEKVQSILSETLDVLFYVTVSNPVHSPYPKLTVSMWYGCETHVISYDPDWQSESHGFK